MLDATNPERVLTELDHTRLTKLIERLSAAGGQHDIADLAHDLLDSSITVPAESIAPDVATMRSRVRLRNSDDGQELDLTLTYPTETDAAEGRISVLSPLGLGLIGCRKGQTVKWQSPDKVVHRGVLVEILYQPEAAGDFGT
jgi:regulator of nucleoside diphosphate kinase